MAAGARKIVWPILQLLRDMYSEENVSFNLFHTYLPRASEIFLIFLLLRYTNY